MPKTKEELDYLKLSWERDPNWDIEETEGFEEYRDELLAFRQQKEREWKEKRAKREEHLRSLLCPVQSRYQVHVTCFTNDCAWWDNKRDKCGMLPQNTVA